MGRTGLLKGASEMSRTEIAAARRSVGQRGMKWMLSGMVVAVAATFAPSRPIGNAGGEPSHDP